MAYQNNKDPLNLILFIFGIRTQFRTRSITRLIILTVIIFNNPIGIFFGLLLSVWTRTRTLASTIIRLFKFVG